MNRTPLTIGALAAGVLTTGLLIAGCQTAEAAPAVRPVNISLATYGGADPPSGEYNDLAVSCVDDLRNGRDADCESRAAAAAASSDSQVAALGESLRFVAQVNQGKYDQARQTLEAAQRKIAEANRSSTKPLTELVYRAESITYAASGDQVSADRAMRTAQAAAPSDRSAEISAERCRAAPAAPSCTAGGTDAPTPTPTDETHEQATGGNGGGQNGQGGDGTTTGNDDHGNDGGGNEDAGGTGEPQDAQPGNP